MSVRSRRGTAASVSRSVPEEGSSLLAGIRRVVRPDSAPRHSREQPVERHFGALERPTRESPRLARATHGRDGLRGNHQPKDILPAGGEVRTRSVAGPFEVTGPPARLGQVEQRVVVELAPAGE